MDREEDDYGQEKRALRLIDLPEHTQKFLSELREEDVEELKESMKFIKNAKTVNRFLKWLVITAVGMFIATVSLGESIIKLKGWFK